MSEGNLLGIAIVQWNHSEQTIRCLQSLVEQQQSCKIALCDNGSLGNHRRALRDYLAANWTLETTSSSSMMLTLLNNRFNSGFARATNTAVRALLDQQCEWIWLLNNDTVLRPGAIQALQARLVNQTPALLGTVIHEGDGERLYGGYIHNYWTTRYWPVREHSQFAAESAQHKYISGASMVVHRSVFEKIGLLTDRHFLYFEELDFISRAQKAGYNQYCLGDVEIDHVGAASSSDARGQYKRLYHETWSTLSFYRNHKLALFPLMLAFRTPIRLASLLISGRAGLMSAVLQATADFLLGRNADEAAVEIELTETFYW